MSLATLGGHTCTRALVQIPAWGRAWAECELAEPEVLTGVQTLRIADASYSMSVQAGGVGEDGRARYRLVAGRGGWGRTLTACSYQNDAGVASAGVIRDAASACGEEIGALPATRFGPHFTREAGPGTALLQAAAPRAWYVDAAGVTQFGSRPAATYAGNATRVRVDPATGVIELAADEIGNLAPGVVVDGGAPASDIEIAIDAKRLTVRVYAAAALPEISASIVALVRSALPWLRFAGTYEFRVVTQEGERLNLQPVRASSGMPDLMRVPVRPGIPGVKAQVTPGELVLVCFADCDPSRPQVIAHSAADSVGWMPLSVQLGETPALGIARMTDPVQAGPFVGIVTQASTRWTAST